MTDLRQLKFLRKREEWQAARIAVSPEQLEEIARDPHTWAEKNLTSASWEWDETTNYDIVIVDDETPGDERTIYEGVADYG